MWNIVVSHKGVYILLIALFLLLLKYFFNFKPKFILPRKFLLKKLRLWWFRQRSYRIWFFVVLKYVLIISVLLSFLQIKFLVGKTIERQKDIPIQILFDVSLSMTADDIKPSRFDAAKMAVSRLMKNLSWYNFSLITFSGIPFVYMPFSHDFKSMSLYWNATTLANFPPVEEFVGTAIWDALILAMENIDHYNSGGDQTGPKVVVLITDGDSNIGYDPVQLIPSLQDNNIIVFSLWVWAEDYLIWYDYFDTPVTTSINTTLLADISKKTGWRFYRILDEKSFSPVFDDIVGVVRAQEREKVVKQYWELNKLLYVLVIVSLVGLLWWRISLLKKSPVVDWWL